MGLLNETSSDTILFNSWMKSYLYGSIKNKNDDIVKFQERIPWDKRLFVFVNHSEAHWNIVCIDKEAKLINVYCSLNRSLNSNDKAVYQYFVGTVLLEKDAYSIENVPQIVQNDSWSCGYWSAIFMLYLKHGSLLFHIDCTQVDVALNVVKELCESRILITIEALNMKLAQKCANIARKKIKIDIENINDIKKEHVTPNLFFTPIKIAPKVSGSGSLTIQNYLDAYRTKEGVLNPEIDVESSCRPLSSENAKYIHDIDSVLLTSKNLDLCRSMRLLPFPNRAAMLRKHNHLYVSADGHNIELYKVPHYEFGTAGTDSVIRILIFFPSLLGKINGRNVNIVSAVNLERFYDECVLPALQKIVPNDVFCHYPLKYSILSKVCTSERGTFTFPGYFIKNEYIQDFVACMRSIIKENSALKEYEDFFFHLYAKNLKLLTKTDCLTTAKISNYLIDLGFIDPSKVIVDIGIEIVPLKTKLNCQYETLLWNIESLQQSIVASGFKKLVRIDSCCLFKNIGGISAESTASFKLTSGLHHFQAYLCEKESLYGFQLGKRNSTYFNIAKEKYMVKYGSMMEAFERAKLQTFGVRLEFRVDLLMASALIHECNVFLPQLIDSNAVLCIDSSDFNDFRVNRLQEYMSGYKIFTLPDRLQLMALLTGALYKRLDDSSYARCILHKFNVYQELAKNIVSVVYLYGIPETLSPVNIVALEASFNYSAQTKDIGNQIFKLFRKSLLDKVPNSSRYFKVVPDSETFLQYQFVNLHCISLISCRGKVIHTDLQLKERKSFKMVRRGNVALQTTFLRPSN